MNWIDRLRGRAKPRIRATGAKAVEPQRWIEAPDGVAAVTRAREWDFPRFQSTASDQFEHRGGDPFSGYRVKLRKAYTPAQPITDRRMLAGRARVLTSLIRAIEDQHLHTVIHGERGLGKTSLLHVLAQAAREARYLVVYVTCGATSTFDEMFRAIAAGIPLIYHKQFGPTAPEAERGDSIASLLPAEPISVRSAEDVLAKVVGTRVLVILDEFDRSESAEFRRNIAELVKSLSDRAVRVQLVIAGVAANLNELVANVPSVQRNIFSMHVPRMSAGEIRELIKNGETVSGLAFDDPAVHAIISRSIGLPYLASLLSHRAALTAVNEGRTTVGAKDVATATDEAVEEFHGRMSRRSQIQIDGLMNKGRLAALGALAGAAQTSGGAFTRDDLNITHANAMTIEEARGLVDSLAATGVLFEAREEGFGRAYKFLEDTVPAYLWLASVEARADVIEQQSRRAAG